MRLRSVAGQESFHNAAAFLRSTFPFFKRLSLSTLIARYSPSVWLTGSASTACNPAPFEMKYWESTEATLFPTPPFPPQEEMNRCILRRTTKVCFARQRLSFHAQARLQSSSVANGNQDGFAPVVSDWRVDHGGAPLPSVGWVCEMASSGLFPHGLADIRLVPLARRTSLQKVSQEISKPSSESRFQI